MYIGPLKTNYPDTGADKNNKLLTIARRALQMYFIGFFSNGLSFYDSAEIYFKDD